MNNGPLQLAPETEAAVEAQHGGPLSCTGERSQYVVMRMEMSTAN
jgi:hypothetical protein